MPNEICNPVEMAIRFGRNQLVHAAILMRQRKQLDAIVHEFSSLKTMDVSIDLYRQEQQRYYDHIDLNTKDLENA